MIEGKTNQGLEHLLSVGGNAMIVGKMTLHIRTKENPDLVWTYRNVKAISVNKDTVDFAVLEDGKAVSYTIRKVISLECN